MGVEGPTNAGESGHEKVDIETMEQELLGQGIKFPETWVQFTDEAKLRAMEAFRQGGITPLGFEILTPDWLDVPTEMGDESGEEEG